MSRWTFVTNHAIVLGFIARHPMITGNEIALEVGISERAVRRIIAELRDGGYLSKKKKGRRVQYQVEQNVPLRHETQEDRTVGDLLRILSARRKRQKNE